jgi:hypothetical protein
MKVTSHEYISMCSGIIDFYNKNKSMISGINELEAHFMDLHIMLIHLNNEHMRITNHLIPTLKEKQKQKIELEDILIKFNIALHKQSLLKNHKKSKKADPQPQVTIQHDLSSNEIIDQYTNIHNRAKNVAKDLATLGVPKEDFQKLEALITSYMLSLPVVNILEERIQQTRTKESKIMSDMEYLLKHQIDPHMKFLKEVDTNLYSQYQDMRKKNGNRHNNETKDRRDAYIIA